MAARATIGIDKFFDGIRRDIAGIDSDIRDALMKAALDFVRNARGHQKGTKDYTDRTSNLRSSIGFIIYKDGREIARNFETAGAGSEDGSRGMAEGQAFAEVQSPNMAGYSIVVVAGMAYAKHVEARGYDVVTNSKEIMVQDIPVLLKIVFAE